MLRLIGQEVEKVCLAATRPELTVSNFAEVVDRFAFIDETGLYVLQVDTGDMRAMGVEDNEELKPTSALCMSHDGRLVAAISDRDGESEVWLFDVESGSKLCSTDTGGGVMGAAFSPDGNILGLGLQEGILRLFAVKRAQETSLGPHKHDDKVNHTDYIRCVSWSAGGDRVATSGDDSKVAVFDLTEGETLWEYEDLSGCEQSDRHSNPLNATRVVWCGVVWCDMV